MGVLMRRGRRAFTLMELVIAMSAISLLLGGLASMVLLTTRTLPEGDDPLAGQLAASRALREMADDMMIATRVLEAGARVLTVVVPDRTNDGNADTIRYTWSGVSGDPLTRSLNGGAARTVLAHCSAFTFAPRTGTTTETYPGALASSGKIALSEHPTAVAPSQLAISPSSRLAQYTLPVLPPDAVDWTPAAVRFRCASNGLPIDVLRMQLQSAGSGYRPSGTALGTATLAELNMAASLRWEELAFDGVAPLPPSQAICIVLDTTSLTAAANVGIDTNTGALVENALVYGNGSTWNTVYTSRALEYQLLGYYRTQTAPKHVTRTYFEGAELSAAAVGSDVTAQLSAVFGNQPESVSGAWELLDYAARSADGNGDGEPDFADVLDGLALVGRTWPDCDFDRNTTIEMVALTDTLALTPATLEGCVDWDGSGNCIALRARLERTSASAQRLTFDLREAGAWATKATVSDLPAEPIDVRLVVSADSDHVNLMVAGRRIGTYTYTAASLAGGKRAVWCNGADLGVDIQRLTVRVGP